MEFRILSYNMHRAIGLDRRFRPERIASILAHHDADIILLQEVDVGVPRSRMLDLAREMADRLEFSHVAVGLNVKLRKGMYGNATLSRFPILQERNIDLTIGALKARGCLFTNLELPGDVTGEMPLGLAVFNLHLGLSARERTQQLGRLVRSAEFSRLSSQDLCLVAGDFNDWRTLLTPILTEFYGFTCATDHGIVTRKPLLTYPSFAPAGGLDKIFCRGRINVLNSRRCRLMTSKVASDHLPVLVDFQVQDADEHISGKTTASRNAG
ncbi:MAG: endonuclease/exonuclease/phosphatase family protein [Proteobacteria bacterium]|nr:endonuclease/exonuclease/phosphatase family protein [Pseudomonadota bacterium]MBU1710099.1 endonuclease/exonuclease/phosphatase family protein [Pseudomonadota bacterium]